MCNKTKNPKLPLTLEDDYLLDEEMKRDLANFEASYGSLIIQAGAVLHRFSNSPSGQKATTDYMAALQTGGDGVEDVTTKLLSKNPELVSLTSSAYKSSLKGMGIGVSGEAALFAGIQGGAEGCVIFPYQIGGNYKTPWKVVGRTWTYKTLGLDLGVSGGLGLTFFLMPPETSNHVTGFYVTLVGLGLPVGARVEVFGWLPSTDENFALASIGKQHVNPFKYIMGFRVTAELGIHGLLGMDRFLKSHQKVTQPGIEGSTYFVDPANLEIGVETEVAFTITHPKRLGNPSRLFQKDGDTVSTMTVKLPRWLSDCVDTLVHTKTGSAPTNTASLNGLENWDLGDHSDSVITLTWAGGNNNTWDSDIAFTISGVIANSDQTSTKGRSTATIKGLKSVGPINHPHVIGGAIISLEQILFKAKLSWQLTVNGKSCTIKDYESSTTLAGDTTVDDSNRPDAGTAFYYVLNTKDTTSSPPYVTLVKKVGQITNEWNCGVQFQQNPSDPTSCQFLTVMYKGANYNSGNNTKKDLPYKPVTTDGVTSTVYFDSTGNNYFKCTATLISD